jgi:alcohol dehydrogenase
LRAFRIHRYGGPERVLAEDLPRPTPGPGDLLVAVRAASVNPVDCKIRDGKVKVLVRDRFPLTLGSDLSGAVIAVGDGVTRFHVGDPVFARLDKDRIGAFAEYALVREGAAAKKPERLTHEEAASLPLVGLTAWQALVELGRVAAGQRVLITAGSGGVGTFAIQLARHLGATVATTASARNRALLERLGAQQVIDYKTTSFPSVLSELDMAFDTQGGQPLLDALTVVRRGGVVVTIGGVPDAKFARSWGLNPLLTLALGFMTRKVTRLARARGVRFEYLFMHADGEALGQIGALCDRGVIRPVVDRIFPFAELRDAMAYVEAGHTVGKVVVKVS